MTRGRGHDTSIPVALTDPQSSDSRARRYIGRLGSGGSEWRDRLVRQAVDGRTATHGATDGSLQMGTHLSMTTRHLAMALTLAVGAAGAVALPAWAASHGKSPAQHQPGHASVGTKVGTGTAV